jgi:hypothetical protein
MKKPIARVQPSSLELRQWCIEQALRWPWNPGSYGSMGQYPAPDRPSSEPDILSRAERILAWATKSAAQSSAIKR